MACTYLLHRYEYDDEVYDETEDVDDDNNG